MEDTGIVDQDRRTEDCIDNLVPDDNTVEHMIVWFDNQSQDHEHISNLIHTQNMSIYYKIRLSPFICNNSSFFKRSSVR